jgi:uncharacterized membrane protein YphA (DoxX/SURF4 family)
MDEWSGVMRGTAIGPLLFQTTRAVLAAVLLWAGVGKLRDTSGFAESARQLIPGRFDGAVRIGAIALPIFEITLAIALVSPSFVIPGLVAAALLFAAFVAILIRARRLGIDAACACFGATDEHPVDSLSVVRTILLALAALIAAWSALTAEHPFRWLFAPGTGALPVSVTSAAVLATALLAGAAMRLLTVIERRMRIEDGAA